MVELTRLAALPAAEPSPARAARTRERCLMELARRPRPARRPGRPAAPVRVGALAWPPALTLLGAAYVAAVIELALDVLAAR